jgi:Flp pilus assembly protein TadB
MSNEMLIPFVAVFAACVMLFLAVWFFVSTALTRRREQMQRRLHGNLDYEGSILLDEVLARRSSGGWAKRFDFFFEQFIARTGLDLPPALALGLIVFSGVALGGFTFVWRYDQEPWLALPAFFLGAAVPVLFFLWRQSAWRRALQNQLPDAFFLLARAMRAGRSLDQSLQLVGEQGVPPLAREFARMHRQIELGLSLSQVLHSAARRLGLIDFNVLASVVSLHRSTGGNLPAILDRLAVAARDRNLFEGQYRAATVLGRYSSAFLLVMVGLITGYLFLFQRAWALRFFDSATGITLFTMAIALEILGGLLLYWFLRYEY